MKMKVGQLNNLTEEKLMEWLKSYLDFGEIVNDDFPSKGVSSWYPYGYALIKNILKLASNILIKNAGFQEIVLPSFVHGEDFMKECRHIKDFSEHVYWSPLYKEDDLHVVTPTIEAQLGSLYARWLRDSKALPYKYFTIRSVARYITGRTIPLRKNRDLWPFFEGLSAHASETDLYHTIQQEAEFMKEFFEILGIPVLIIETPKITPKLQEYSERRIEVITITQDKRVVILATIYDLGKMFSKVYDISYSVKNTKYYTLMTAIGLSGRVLATLLTINGDNEGFIIPPFLAPVLVAILPVYDKNILNKQAKKIEKYLLSKEITSKVFLATSSLGERRRKIKAMGIPFIIEIGPNEIKSSVIQVKQRIETNVVNCSLEKLPKIIKTQCKSLEKTIKSRAVGQFKLLNRTAKSKVDFLYFARNELLTKASLCDKSTCYEGISKQTSKKIIGRAYDESLDSKDKCIICGKTAVQNLYFGAKWRGEK